MAFIQENKIEINLNLKKPYKLIHFSDVHIVNLNDNETNEALEKAKKAEEAWYKVRKDFAIFFNEVCNDEHMIPSCECLDKLLKYSVDEKPDALVMSGDLIDYNSDANIKYLEESLKDINIPYIICCGNHEYPSSIFNKLTNNHSDYDVLDLEEFKIVSLNNSRKVFYKEQIEFLKNELKDNKPIIITFHIPILTNYNKKEMQKFDQYFIINYEETDDVSKEMIDLLMNEKQIKAILCGHTHGKGLSYFAKDKPQYCASSGLIGYVNNICVK